ncbi:aminotransferase class I/II-fold pyridoxal phosphate-dependent enzyme [Pseudoduganella chitinolytica]|uniref:Aminotransferase class I/II-fold pyridoxal phosphate-dependent enzyme n=1 Tax=Pseudoduganella chitinolytica TaxID=34070 RepID=A0ABY8BIE7_9BURK|nr:aminotransferase class I/II-fold pyridoxal phosphate-dependent enzyme [Pseudoduganella chitinolytica]WEF34701.1 aminotransferase class I/II-fold pyridoxal phosphate-dependent enzyme [Pseudoduganella chitinolytica]
MSAAATGPLDFTSALYLGLRHPGCALDGWDALTLGKPAALQDVPGAREVAAALARLQGCAAATLLPSTLHLFWDLFGMLGRERFALLVDGAAYPVARWGAERATGLGLPLRTFGHGDVAGLERLALAWHDSGRRPLILADGYSPGAAQAPPLAAYAAVAQRHGGLLLLDDTQALGLLGRHGGGSARRHGIAGMPVLVGASLAKAFGVPLAVLAGGAAWVRRFERVSDTRLHASPPSQAVVAAARRALRINAVCGDALRRTLAQRVAQFRAAAQGAGLPCDGGAFPVQSVTLPAGADLAAAHAALCHAGVLALPQYRAGRARLTFLLRADHAPTDVARAAQVLARVVTRAKVHELKELRELT